jgi:hypothetical protein
MNSLFPGAKGESVLLVWDYCIARKLDPLKKPCHIVPMEVKVGDKYEWRDVVMPGIYEHRTTAQRTGQYLGHSKPEYGPMAECAGVQAPEWCELTVYRWNDVAGMKVEFPVRTFFREVVATKRDGKANSRWARAPIQMLVKCFDPETEILTDEGFQRFADVADARVLQVTTDGRLEAVHVTPFAQNYDGAMVTLDSDDLNFCVTPNHDMLTTHGKIEAGAMYDQSRARPKFWIPRVLSGSHSDASISDAGLRLAAAYLADGSDHSRGNVFTIEVSRPAKVKALRDLALHSREGIGTKAGATAHTSSRTIVTQVTQTRFTYASVLVEPLAQRGKAINIPFLLTLSRRQARIFVDTLLEFDGHLDPLSGVRRFYTSRAHHLHAFEIGSIIAGYAVNRPIERLSDISSTPNFMITISERNEIPVIRWGRGNDRRSRKNEGGRTGLELRPNSSGTVWCVAVPSGVIVVRRHGFSMLCGNCTEAAALREAFPDELGGEQTAEEMDGQRAIDVPATITPPIPKPEGYDEVITDLTASADEGLDALERAYKQVKKPHRDYLAATEPDGLELLKAKARQVDAKKAGDPPAADGLAF